MRLAYSTSADHQVACDTRWAPRGHWPLTWQETESHCLTPDDIVLGDSTEPVIQASNIFQSMRRPPHYPLK